MYHHFGHTIYSGLDEKLMDSINRVDLFDLGLAGPDLFSKIKFLSKKKNKEYLDTTLVFDTQDTKKYFITLCNLVEKDKNLFGYLCGEVAHYFLDVFTNPFIYYYSGKYDLNVNNTLKYRGIKEKLISQMDAVCVNSYYNSDPSKFNFLDTVFKVHKLDDSFKNSFNALFLEAYNLKDGYGLINKAIGANRKYYRLIHDPLGFKTKLLKVKDDGVSETVYKNIFLNDKMLENNVDIFNKNNNQWLNPVDSEIKSTSSFWDLFEGARVIATKCINDLYKHFFMNEEIELDYYFNNLSYITGIECTKKNSLVNFANNI